MWEKAAKWLVKHEWLIIILAVVIVLRIPTLFEPYWYGDEGIYLTIGRALRAGSNLYKDIHDNKPPLLYLAAAVVNGNQFWYRMVAMLINLASVFVLARMADKLFKESLWVRAGVVWLFALLTNLPLFEGNIANAELFFLLPTLIAAMWLMDKQVTAKRIFWAGVMIGLAGLFKIPAVLEAAVWPLVWWAGNEKGWFSKSFVLGVGVGIPLALSGIYFAGQGVLMPYLVAAGLQNVPYLSSWTPGSGGIYSLKGRAAVLAVWLAVLWGLARRIGREGTWVGIWGGITLFAALLSGRPYPHYLLQMAGVLSIGWGILWMGKRSEKVVVAVLVTMVVLAWQAFHFYGYQVGGYYTNFLRWVAGRQNLQSYYGWFNPQVNNNYEVAKILMGGSGAGDKVFIWGDEPMVYALAKRQPVGRFTVKYHIKDFGAQAETVEKIMTELPVYIVSYGAEEELPGLREILAGRYNLEKEVGSAKIYRRSALSWWTY